MTKFVRLLRTAGPFAVSAAVLVFLLAREDWREVAEKLSLDAAKILVPALLGFGALSLLIEALSLVRLVPRSDTTLDVATAARLKAASYLVGLINYLLGAGALSVLLRRRAGLSLADAAGVVLLISAVDLGMLFLLAGLGTALTASDNVAVQTGVVAGGIAALVGGFVLMRVPGSLGPLERLRELALFRAVRSTSLVVLLELGILRLAFVTSFMALGWVTLYAFSVRVPVAELVVDFAVVSLVAILPIAFSGLGTGQAAFTYVFQEWASSETLLAASLSLSFGLLLMRALIGLVFAREYTREALAAAHEADA